MYTLLYRWFLLLFVFHCACSTPSTPTDAGLWPIPRMDSLDALKKNHRALEQLSHNDPHNACTFAQFAIAEWLLAIYDLPQGHKDTLFSHFGIACPNAWRNPDCATRLFDVIQNAFMRCSTANVELSTWGLRFVEWQKKLKNAWDFKYFEEAITLLKSPLSRETRIALLGTLVHALPLLLQRSWQKRTEAFVRWLGFPCPVWAASFTQAGPEDNPADWPTFCMLSCPNAHISEPLADFSLRAKKLAAACPAQTVGLAQPQDYRFYTLDNHLVFRTSVFWRQLLADMRSDPHPLTWMYASLLATTQTQWERLQLPLFPSAQFKENSPIGTPDYSLAAVEPVSWPVVHIHAFGAFQIEEEATYHVASGQIIVRPSTFTAAPSFVDAVQKIAALSEPTLSLSGPVSSDQLLKAAEIFRQKGHTRLRFLFRNASQVLRACTIELSRPFVAEHDIVLTLSHDTLTLSSSSGMLHTNPFRAAGPHDFSGLRQKLEQLRPKTPQTAVVHLQIKSGVAFSSVAKLLGYVMRNASGRKLFGTVRLVTSEK